MTLFTLLFMLFFVVLIVGGILIHAYLYANGVFHEGPFRKRKRRGLSMGNFSQMATIVPSAVANDLYYGGIGVPNEDRIGTYMRRLIGYSLAIIVVVLVLAVLVLTATQF